jgi:hypothetical protein
VVQAAHTYEEQTNPVKERVADNGEQGQGDLLRMSQGTPANVSISIR